MEARLGRLLRPPRLGAHPLRHLRIIHWLFGDARHLERAMRDAGTVSTGGRQHRAQPVFPADDPRKGQLCNRIRKHGHLLRKAASWVGVDTQTALVWAASSGIDLPRRPQKLTDDVRTKAIRDLRKGADKSRVATRASVSVETITRLLLSDAQLHADWLSARRAKYRTHCRAEWMSTEFGGKRELHMSSALTSPPNPHSLQPCLNPAPSSSA
ncbi:TnsD family Tn7-like transposition protein [Acidovorax soli]|uniref:TnsD family Tn7-like transposition protein n=1 Tax=Acidovorax soli TaxID=592050 RepID=UPI0039089A1D